MNCPYARFTNKVGQAPQKCLIAAAEYDRIRVG
jgi:hypothetical protein